MTVRENLEYFGALNGVPGAATQARIVELLEITDLAPFELSLIHISEPTRPY